MNHRVATTALLCLALVFSAVTGLFAQQQDSPQPSAQPWYIGKPISSFTFSGLVTVKEVDLQTVLKPYIGVKFSVDPVLMDIQSKLYALDYFESIEPTAVAGDAEQTTLVIQFKVKERPSVASVQVKGNATVRTNEITDKILLKKGDLANQTRLQADVEAVKSLYLDKGYTDVTVSAGFEPTEGTNAVNAVFTVSEGAPTTIKEIRFSGNTFASESTLRGVMKTKAQFLFDSGVFQESKLEEDKAAIVGYYTERGYIDAKVDQITREVQSDKGRNYLILTIYITEGAQWTYGGITFIGNKVFTTQQLNDLAYQKAGRLVSLQKVQEDISRVRALYYDNGYIYNVFTPTDSRDPASHTISYTLTIQETDKAHIEKIIFKGNTRTKENVLRRGLPFEEGDIFNREKIIQGYQYLQNLQYFKSVTPDTQQGSEYGLMNVVFNVEETSTADINFGVVFSGGDYPISGTIKWNERNFLGAGQTIGVDLEANTLKQLVALNYSEPWMFNVPWSGSLSLSVDHLTNTNVLQDFLSPVFSDTQSSTAAPDPYATRADYLAALADGQSIPSQYLMQYDSYDITVGGATGYTFTYPFGRLGMSLSYTPTWRYVNYDESLFRPFEVNVRDNNHTWIFIDKIGVSVSLDGRDIYWNPTKGYLASQSFTYVGGILYGDREYIRSDSTLEGFLTLLDLPVTDSWNLQFVLAAHSALSFILPNYSVASNGWTTKTDYTDQLYIDGQIVGRGWKILYGNALWDNRVELRMPILKDTLWAVGFFDAAGLWDQPFGAASPETSFTDLFTTGSLNQMYFSFGGGIRFSIPQFPIRLYLAKGFQIKDGQFVWKPKASSDLAIGDFSFAFVISLGGNVF